MSSKTYNKKINSKDKDKDKINNYNEIKNDDKKVEEQEEIEKLELLLNSEKTQVNEVIKKQVKKIIKEPKEPKEPKEVKDNKKIFVKNSEILNSENTNINFNFNSTTNNEMPKNYGNKWTDEDKNLLIELLKTNTNKEIDYAEIAQKLGRTEGGVKGEVKKMIVRRYLNGEEADLISIDLNIQYKFVKIMLKSYFDNEIEEDIKNLEKENTFLKLKMENLKLRETMLAISKQ
jgi:hypothetical protein